MQRVPVLDAARRFVDLEAEVDSGGVEGELEDEDVGLDLDGFIDDRDYLDSPHYDIDDDAPAELFSWRDCAVEATDDLSDANNLLKRIMDRINRPRRMSLQGVHNHNSICETHLPLILRSPTEEDYPLWRVRCRVKLEEEAVFFLLQTAKPKHQLRAAFTRGALRGWFYIEATMNPTLRHLLVRTPGVVRSENGAHVEEIEFGDWTGLLKMHDPATGVGVGQWVRVCKGAYKGDIGYVAAMENCDVASLLLVPRLPPPLHSDVVPTKRKHTTTQPVPELFDLRTSKKTYGVQPFQETDAGGVYSFKGMAFEHGLIVKSFDLHSLSSASVFMPSLFFMLFQASGHPTILASTFPRPLEWNFYEGELVYVVSLDKKGVISVAGSDRVEVDFALTNEGLRSVSWYDLRKVIAAGDFIEVTGGELIGEMGWVESVDDDVAQVIEGLAQNFSGRPKRFGVHVNWVKVTDPPFIHESSPTSVTHHKHSDPVPWIGIEVTVVKIGHPMKGYHGVVKDVFCGQPTFSGLRVAVQFTHLNPSNPFKTTVFDYDHIIESTHRCKLYNFKRPISPLFHPLPQHQQVYGNSMPRVPESQLVTNLSSYMVVPECPLPSPTWNAFPQITTRAESPSAPLSPAWDPSSRTPSISVIRDDPVAETCSQGSGSFRAQSAEEHVFLDSRLIGAKLKATINGGEYKNKEAFVDVEMVNGHPDIRYHHYNTARHLPAKWVAAKHPNPTRENGLLVVIKGEHCGKYVRRIHHRYDDGEAIMNLATFEKGAGGTSTLTEERLELVADQVCVAFESKEERKLGDALLKPIRDEARKIRAK